MALKDFFTKYTHCITDIADSSEAALQKARSQVPFPANSSFYNSYKEAITPMYKGPVDELEYQVSIQYSLTRKGKSELERKARPVAQPSVRQQEYRRSSPGAAPLEKSLKDF